jgi:cytochrome c-type biogenesis protein
MEGLTAALAAAFWLGILTSISPCPLATNVAAVSFIAREVGSTRRVLLAGAAYTLGRALAYAGLAFVLVRGVLSIPAIAIVLQRHMNQILGPLLVVVGMFLLGMLGSGVSTSVGSDEVRRRAARGGLTGAVFLGVLFALSFCPVSAALYFGSLIPMAVDHQASGVLPVVYGIGTGFPVLVLGGVVGGGGQVLGTVLRRLTRVELWARRVTGWVFVAVGVYLSVRFIFLG